MSKSKSPNRGRGNGRNGNGSGRNPHETRDIVFDALRMLIGAWLATRSIGAAFFMITGGVLMLWFITLLQYLVR